MESPFIVQIEGTLILRIVQLLNRTIPVITDMDFHPSAFLQRLTPKNSDSPFLSPEPIGPT